MRPGSSSLSPDTNADVCRSISVQARFRAGTSLSIDAQGQFALTFSYTDDKSELGYDDQGEIQQVGETGGSIALLFGSSVYHDQWQGIAVDGVVMFTYDFDGDGQPETTFGFQRVG